MGTQIRGSTPIGSPPTNTSKIAFSNPTIDGTKFFYARLTFPATFDAGYSDDRHCLAYSYQGSSMNFIYTSANTAIVRGPVISALDLPTVQSRAAFKDLPAPIEIQVNTTEIPRDTRFHHYEIHKPALSNAALEARFNELRAQYQTLY